jgi:DNA-damage-inducible protein J
MRDPLTLAADAELEALSRVACTLEPEPEPDNERCPALTRRMPGDTMYLMATTAMVHVRVDVKMKARAEKALSAMGLSVSDAVRVLLTRVAAEQALPFEVRVPNSRTRAAMKEARRGGLRAHDTVGDLMADLNAED